MLYNAMLTRGQFTSYNHGDWHGGHKATVPAPCCPVKDPVHQWKDPVTLHRMLPDNLQLQSGTTPAVRVIVGQVQYTVRTCSSTTAIATALTTITTTTTSPPVALHMHVA
jgi:hypothetical protein